MKNNPTVKPIAILLAWLVPASAMAQQDASLTRPLVPDEPARLVGVLPTAPETPQAVNPKWLKKKVVVYLHDGSRVEGRLTGVTPESLVVKVATGKKPNGKSIYEKRTIPLAEVESVGRRVKPKLVGEKVVVYLDDGHSVTGRLTKLTEDSLQLEGKWGKREFPLREVARVKHKPVNWGKALDVAAGVAGLMLFSVVCAAAESSGDSCFDQ